MDSLRSDGGELRQYLSPLAVWALSIGCAVGWGAFVKLVNGVFSSDERKKESEAPEPTDGFLRVRARPSAGQRAQKPKRVPAA